MIGELIQFFFSLIFTSLRATLTSRVITILFLFFLFLVSLGAAEEKQMKNGKVGTTHQRKSGNRQGNSHSLRKMSSASNMLNMSKPVKKSSQSKRSSILSYLPIAVLVLLFGYSALSSSSLHRKNHTPAAVPVVDSSYESFYDSVGEFFVIVKNTLYSVGSSLRSALHTLFYLVRSLDFDQYILLFKSFYAKMPVIAVICLVTFSIIAFVLVVLSIYVFCKLFLFISDKPDSISVTNDNTSTTSVHLQRRQSIVSEHKKPRKTISPYPMNSIEEPFSMTPFTNLRRLCVSSTSQLSYNSFVQCFLRSHSLSHNQAAMLSSTLFLIDSNSMPRTSPSIFFPSKPESDRTDFPANPSVPPEVVPAVPKVPAIENADVHSPIAIDEPVSKPSNDPPTKSEWNEELMGNMDPELFASIMKDVEQVTNESTMSVTEASNTMKRGILAGSQGVAGSLGMAANPVIGMDDASKSNGRSSGYNPLSATLGTNPVNNMNNPNNKGKAVPIVSEDPITLGCRVC